MSHPQPIKFRWDGEAMAPLDPRAADREYAIGETYPLVVYEGRSQASHDHFFAALHDAWLNLPEAATERFPTKDHLRKYALIKTGYRDERSLACSSKAEALRVAAFVRPQDDFAVVIVSGSLVTVYTAKSQSKKAMGKAVFQQSKDAVLTYVAGLIGATPEQLGRAA